MRVRRARDESSGDRGWGAPRAGCRGVQLAALAAALACASAPRSGLPAGAALAFPARDPRVRLEAIVRLDQPPTGSGARLLSWLGGRQEQVMLERPYGVAWDGDDLLVTDPGAGRILRLGPGRRVLSSPPGELRSPMAVTPCRGGIVVADSRAGLVALLGPDLKFRARLAEGLERPSGVACVGERVFVVETGAHRVVVLEPDGRRSSIGRRGDQPGEFNFPAAIVAHGASVWVGDTLNFRVQRLDAASGAVLAAFGRLGDAPGELPRLKGIAVDGAGRLWIADALLDRVSIFTASGEFLLDLGRHGSAPGELSFPAGIAAHPDGRVAVVDSLNRRIQVFRPLPEEGSAP